ncbi:5-methyltetrahydropteroyltriglutamate--homocysteine S-methyltransferase [Luteolibacter yonseiensis]|uniref:5-methyltetrahydropteroyltriglutamate--homocysteine methyltransferase n=1 Tax=Luteolibacter yonseiensis TaxID=1144680 RepID=A0A934R312_9BACT|nr:5-methyltetrahydropteroyltriglutamate--homocysteine S-methyltransferase [Luteolibacter yonseiensis]MBK1815939.1 5-methyltetrahydropteroyltriglutamate--homocysteine S-methyltransferase [Luteolibacter yonseiensis]
MSSIRTHNLGYPRIGEHRELKKATEAYWQGKISREELEDTGRRLRRGNWLKQQAAGIDLIPCNDFSFYDQVLDATCLLGNIPPRFGRQDASDPDSLFLIARGSRDTADNCGDGCGCQTGTFASEMTKWFDTNYHYIVPEFHAGTEFKVSGTKVFDEFQEALALGIHAKPVLIGPVTYLSLGKSHDADFDRFSLLDGLVAAYEEIIGRLAALGATWIQIDEPILATDLDDRRRDAFLEAYARLATVAGNTRLMVASYFGGLRDNLPLFLSLPVAGLHFDAVRGSDEVPELLEKFPEDKVLSLGVVDGRNIWRNDFDASLGLLAEAEARLGKERLWIAPSCSLIHSPVTLENEPKLDPEIKNWLAFADEKLAEVSALGDLLGGRAGPGVLEENRAAHLGRRGSPRIHNPAVRARLAAVAPQDLERRSRFPERQALQREKLKLPLFPTTTIGSFPQTAEVRSARARWKSGLLPAVAYDAFIKEETRRCVAFQDEIGIDMPVHGEFERNDMVEYFGEQLEGFTFTANGWVQSYGTRCVKPPVIFGDVSRPRPMTTYWSGFAKSLTERPMKGMLTGPVTILQWSFVRNDQPRETTTRQIALAIRDEVLDLEAIGLAAIQIDEPAIREGLPLRRADWDPYLAWAVDAFRLCASGVRDETQIHTHMCYSEFNDIIGAIAALDADVITIETSRSNMELLDAFVDFNYPNEIGPGVYDIHSPRVPGVAEMRHLMEKAGAVIPTGNLWVNPDCGLKTRGWPEVRASLVHMVACARALREKSNASLR